jgi:hypothetical protein
MDQGDKSPISDVHFHESDSMQVQQTNERGTMFDSSGHVMMRTANGWSVDMLVKGHSPNELNCVVYDKSGKVHHPLVSFPAHQGNAGDQLKMHVLVELPLTQTDILEIQTREGQAVDFNHVVVRPDLLGK